jgi:hypothetical protein
MHKSATKCNETIGKWYENKHGASKIIDTFETYQTINLLPVLRRNPRLIQNLKLSAFTARAWDTGSVTAQSIWQIRRMGRLIKVYMIYMLLMCTLLVVAIAPGYLILAQLLTYVTRNRG